MRDPSYSRLCAHLFIRACLRTITFDTLNRSNQSGRSVSWYVLRFIVLLAVILVVLMIVKKSLMRVLWQTSYGQTQMRRKRILRSLHGRISFRFQYGHISSDRVISQWCGLHLWVGRCVQVPGNQPNVAHPASPPAVHGRLYITVRRTPFNGLVRAKLLLSLRERC